MIDPNHHPAPGCVEGEQLQAVRAALALEDHPYADRLSWLDALLSELERKNWPREHVDPEAARECLAECRALHRELVEVFAAELEARAQAQRVPVPNEQGESEPLPF